MSSEKLLRKTDGDGVDLSMKRPTLGSRMVKDKTGHECLGKTLVDREDKRRRRRMRPVKGCLRKLMLHVHADAARGGDLGGRSPPNLRWGGGPCIGTPNILRSSVGGWARKLEEREK